MHNIRLLAVHVKLSSGAKTTGYPCRCRDVQNLAVADVLDVVAGAGAVRTKPALTLIAWCSASESAAGARTCMLTTPLDDEAEIKQVVPVA